VPKLLGELDDLGCKALEVRCFHAVPLGELRAILAAAFYGRSARSTCCSFLPRAEPRGPHRPRRRAPLGSAASWSTRRPRTPDPSLAHRRHGVLPDGGHRLPPPVAARSTPATSWSTSRPSPRGKRHNTCLNRKISVDARGEIRNCPVAAAVVRQRARGVAAQRAAHRDFAALWSINKDQIEVCKDCEFRYVCTDCRAYLQDPSDLYSKPSKCNYDPYTAEWRSSAEPPAALAGATKGDSA